MFWLSLLGCSTSPDGKLVQLAPESRTSADSEGPFVAGATAAVTVAAASDDDGTALSACFCCCASSMTVKTLRSFDSALREPEPGGEDDGVRLVRRGGEDDRFFVVGVLGSELDACAHPTLVPIANTSLVTVCGVTVEGLGDDDGARMERGGRMLNI